MIQSDRTTSTWLAGTGLRPLGLGLFLLAGMPGADCSLGTPPEYLEVPDARPLPSDAAPAPVDAAVTTGPPTAIPPLDLETWDATATATFALG